LFGCVKVLTGQGTPLGWSDAPWSGNRGKAIVAATDATLTIAPPEAPGPEAIGVL